MTAQYKPGFWTPRCVRNQERNVLGSVTRSVQDADLYVAQIQVVSVAHRQELILDSGIRVKNVLCTRHLCQLAASRNMVGVDMRIYDVADLHSAFVGNLQVRLGIIDWVAHGG